MNRLTIRYYNTSNPYNVLTKKLSYITGNQITRNKDTVDIVRPVLEVEYDASLLECNYIHIAEFARYYFASVEVMTGGRLRISGKSDPLMTMADTIRNSGDCLVLRSANNVASYLQDSEQALSTQKTVTVKKFPYEFKEFSIMLLAAGGN